MVPVMAFFKNLICNPRFFHQFRFFVGKFPIWCKLIKIKFNDIVKVFTREIGVIKMDLTDFIPVYFENDFLIKFSRVKITKISLVFGRRWALTALDKVLKY